MELMLNFCSWITSFQSLKHRMIQVINRALDILEYVSTEPAKPKLLGHIANDLQLNPATCANIVKTLVIRGYLEKSDLQKGYIPGKKTMLLSGDNSSLIAAADNEMEAISREINEKCLIAVLRADKRIVIHKNNCNQMVQANTPDEKKAYDSSTGRLLVAMLSDEDLEKYINKFGLPPAAIWPEAHTIEKFKEQIRMIRKNRYALIEDSVQVIGIAAPIYQKGKLVASLSIYLPAFRFSNTTRTKMIQLCTSSANKISAELA